MLESSPDFQKIFWCPRVGHIKKDKMLLEERGFWGGSDEKLLWLAFLSLFTCCSVTSSLAARSARSPELRYFWFSNVFSKLNICRPKTKCYNCVTTMLQPCYDHVTFMLQLCYNHIASMLESCYVKIMNNQMLRSMLQYLQPRFSNITVMLHPCYNPPTVLINQIIIQCCYNQVITKLQPY